MASLACLEECMKRAFFPVKMETSAFQAKYYAE